MLRHAVAVLAVLQLLAVAAAVGEEGPICNRQSFTQPLPPLNGTKPLRLSLRVGDTLVLTPPANWPRGASKPPNLYWLKRGACPKRGGLRHDPLALGLVRLSPSVNRFGKRLELSFDAPGTYTYSTDYASSCASGRVVVRVRGRAFDCPRPIPARPGCNVDGSSSTSGGAPILPCFCAGLNGWYPNTSKGCTSAFLCTGVRGAHLEVGCPPGKRFSAVTEACVADAQCGAPAAYFGGSFLGAYPDNQPPPPIPSVPAAKPFFHILSFAREEEKNRDGVFKPMWDTWGPDLTPQAILSSKLANPNRRFLLSIAGWGHPFQCPPAASRALWLSNAVNSLVGLMAQFHLEGVDINYEGCPLQPDCKDFNAQVTQCFVDVMGALISGLKARNPNIYITISPYQSTWPAYRPLMAAYGAQVQTVLWQSYPFAQPTDASGFIARLQELARDPVLGSYDKLTWGVCTTGAPLPWRGLQAPFVYDVYRGLRAKGVQGFFTWSLEDSAKQGFAAEGTMQLMP